MMEIFNKIKENKLSFNLHYNEKEQLKGMSTAFISFLLIFVPIFLVVYQLFYCFIMVPYLMATISVVVAYILMFIYFLLKRSVFRNIRIVEGLNYFYNDLLTILILSLVILGIYLFGVIYLIPKFIL